MLLLLDFRTLIILWCPENNTFRKLCLLLLSDAKVDATNSVVPVSSFCPSRVGAAVGANLCAQHPLEVNGKEIRGVADKE